MFHNDNFGTSDRTLAFVLLYNEKDTDVIEWRRSVPIIQYC